MIKSLLSLFLLTHVSLADFFKVPLNDLKIEVPEFEVLRENFESRTWQGGFQSSVPIPRFAEFAFVVPGLEKPLNERPAHGKGFWMCGTRRKESGRVWRAGSIPKNW
jgi:hypothetical protein